MAVDTAAKRRSMLNFGSDSLDNSFLPDGTIGANDRAHLLGLYAGISLTTGGTTPSADPDPGVAYWAGPMTRSPRRISA